MADKKSAGTNKKGRSSNSAGNTGDTKRTVFSVILVISALIMGVLIVVLVYRKNHPTNIVPQETSRTIEGDYPMPSEIIESDRSTYFSYTEVPAFIKNKMTYSYQEDGPVTWDDLRYLQLLYWGTDDQPHKGEMIVNVLIADRASKIFYELYKASYTIESVKLIDEFGGNDEVSMANNNTSCFNMRPMVGSDNKWSLHAYGLAIDINPLYNPYVHDDEIYPVTAVKYADRSSNFIMKIDENDFAYRIFVKYGFNWGGNWTNVKDYQHFEYNEE